MKKLKLLTTLITLGILGISSLTKAVSPTPLDGINNIIAGILQNGTNGFAYQLQTDKEVIDIQIGNVNHYIKREIEDFLEDRVDQSIKLSGNFVGESDSGRRVFSIYGVPFSLPLSLSEPSNGNILFKTCGGQDTDIIAKVYLTRSGQFTITAESSKGNFDSLCKPKVFSDSGMIYALECSGKWNDSEFSDAHLLGADGVLNTLLLKEPGQTENQTYECF